MSVRKHLKTAPLFLLLALACVAQTASEHERLRYRNTFKTPEEVVRYYCGRDASGFVWSGLLEIERKAFTFWKDLPQQDSFYIAEKYDVTPAKVSGGAQATVEVHYSLLGVGDAHGTVVPPKEHTRTVTFILKKDQGAWKIAQPDGLSIAPVVLASKFQYAGNGQ